MSFFSKLFSGGGDMPNPADAAMPYLNQIPGVGKEQYSPYINEGNEARQQLQPLYQSLMDDPSAFINSLMQSYRPSEGYQFKADQLSKSLGSTARAGGIAGTPYHQEQQGELINGLLSGDMQQWLNNLMTAFGTGVTGEEGFVTRGFQSSDKLADLLASVLGSQSTLAYQGQASENQRQSDFYNALAGALGKGAGAVGGYLLGGR